MASFSLEVMSTKSALALNQAENALIIFGAFVILNISVVSIPLAAPHWVSVIFFAIGLIATFVWAVIPNLNPPNLSPSQSGILLAVASILTSVGGYIAMSYGSLWYAGLSVGIIGAAVAAIEEYVNGKPPPSPPATSSSR